MALTRRLSAGFVAVAVLAALVLAVVRLDTEPSARTPPVVQLPSAQTHAETAGTAGQTAGWGLPSTWCGTPADADVEHVGDAERAGAPTVKVIYARPSDVPDRFAATADELQRMASRTGLFIAQESRGALTVRWDLGTRCSHDALDLERVALPRKRVEYLSEAGVGGPLSTLGSRTFWLLRSDLMQEALPLRSPAPRNYLVLVDGLSVPGLAGIADQPSEVLSSDDLGESGTTYMGNLAVVFGRDAWNSDTPAHELWHTLSAAAQNAPNATAGASGHCDDGGSDEGVDTDLMCYSQASRAKPPCPGAAETVLNLRLDCRHDDYYAMPEDLVPGSWLAQHPEHNTANSAFLAPCTELPVACGRMPAVMALARAGQVPAAHGLALDPCKRRHCRSRTGRAAQARTLRVISRWESWGTLVLRANLPPAPRGAEWRMCLRRSDASTPRRAARDLLRSARSENCVFQRGQSVTLRVRAQQQLDLGPDRGRARWVAPVIELREQKSWRLVRSYNASGRQAFATTR